MGISFVRNDVINTLETTRPLPIEIVLNLYYSHWFVLFVNIVPKRTEHVDATIWRGNKIFKVWIVIDDPWARRYDAIYIDKFPVVKVVPITKWTINEPINDKTFLLNVVSV